LYIILIVNIYKNIHVMQLFKICTICDIFIVLLTLISVKESLSFLENGIIIARNKCYTTLAHYLIYIDNGTMN